MNTNDPAIIDAEMGQQIMARIESLAAISEEPPKLTRQYLSPEHARANALVADWMQQAGMQTRVDAVGNVIGRYESHEPGQPALMFGSHLDTVRDGGRYDGMLGVLTPISCVSRLNDDQQRLDHAIEVIGFADEEGVRFQSTLLGSRAVAGTFDTDLLEKRDANGISMAQALRDFGLDPGAVASAARSRDQIAAYIELHIEQGPVLEAQDKAVGVVTSIAGATRMMVTVSGEAGHAGTVPMRLRRDALAAACEMVCAVEQSVLAATDVVGTVGQLEVEPGAVNVIAGVTRFSIDMRAGEDGLRQQTVKSVREALQKIATTRSVRIQIEVTHDTPSCQCAGWLMEQLQSAAGATTEAVPRLASGAGHDAMAMIDVADVAMLFVRCERGISHHPDENITTADAAAGAETLLRFMRDFQLNSGA